MNTEKTTHVIGMENKPVLHFAHANSFPAGTYRIFFDHLRKHYDVQALDMHAHNAKYPVKNGWRELAQELVDELIARYDQPVILVGHSLGGILCLMAAHARPDLVRCAVLLDAPLLAGWKAWAFRLSRLVGADKKFSPARYSERRRFVWPDEEAMYQHFSSKEMFAVWPPEVLRDYIKHGVVPHPKGVTLRFDRNTETAIYRSLPHQLGRLVQQTFPAPIGFLGGSESYESQQVGLSATKRLVGKHFRQIPGGHLFPLESPALAAKALHELIEALLDK
jgi:pimeloyl-ACP methyl ester carboxylesterase